MNGSPANELAKVADPRVRLPLGRLAFDSMALAGDALRIRLHAPERAQAVQLDGLCTFLMGTAGLEPATSRV